MIIHKLIVLQNLQFSGKFYQKFMELSVDQ